MHRLTLLLAALLRNDRRRLPVWRTLACLMLGACAIGQAAACPLKAPKARFTDLAGLPGLHADKIADRLAAIQQASGHQVFVLVVPSLEGGESIEQCAVTVFQNWKIGRKGVDDGVLLLVAVKEHKMRIEVGYGLEGVLTDAQSSRIIHEVMQPLFARGEFGEGIDNGLVAIMAVIGSTHPPAAANESVRSAADATGDGKAARIFGTVMLLLFLVASPIMGIVGFLAFGAMANLLAQWMYSDWRANMVAAIWCAAWWALRWWAIQANVRRYRLENARYSALTWIWCFLIFGTAGQARQAKARTVAAGSAPSDDGVSFSFDTDADADNDSDNDSDSDSSSESTSESTSESGGESGGGGASGDW